MKKLDNFSNCLTILRNADFKLADNNDIYRTGVIGQFNLTFELAWKALQEILRLHGAEGADTGSPREILQLGYKLGFVNDSAVWLLMLKKRNTSVHIYNEQAVVHIFYKLSCFFRDLHLRDPDPFQIQADFFQDALIGLQRLGSFFRKFVGVCKIACADALLKKTADRTVTDSAGIRDQCHAASSFTDLCKLREIAYL